MGDRLTGSMITVAIAAAALGAVLAVSTPRTSAQAPALKTPWGDPDLQGIWTDESDVPLQRPARYGNQEFFTAEQRAGDSFGNDRFVLAHQPAMDEDRHHVRSTSAARRAVKGPVREDMDRWRRADCPRQGLRCQAKPLRARSVRIEPFD